MTAPLPPLDLAKRVSAFSLFTSSATLICCALPATLVAMGAAASLVSLLSRFPQLIWISEHKAAVFTLAGLALLIAGGMQWRLRRLPCPADPALAQACMRTRKQSLWMYAISVAMFILGSAFAFVLPWL